MQIQLLAKFSATWFSNSTNLPHIGVRQQGSNTQHNNRTDTTCASRSPNKTPPTNRTTHPPTDQEMHPPTNPLTMLQHYSAQQTDALFRTRTSPESRPVIQRGEQNTAVVPKTVTAASSPTGTKALTHARNDCHLPAKLTAGQRTNPS